MRTNGQRMARLRAQLLEALLSGDDEQVRLTCERAINENQPPLAVELQLVLPAVRMLGELWARGEINVAIEHRAIEMATIQLARLRDDFVPHPPLDLRAVSTTVEGELHALGSRAAADVLICDGWHVDHLGANLPTLDLVEFVQQNHVDLVVLTVQVPDHLPKAIQAIRALKALENAPKIVVGGAATEVAEHHERLSEADALVDDLEQLSGTARELCGVGNHRSLDTYLQRIGERIQQRRRRLGWNQATLAEHAGLDRSYISALERGKQNVTLAALLKTANALQTSLDALLGDIREA